MKSRALRKKSWLFGSVVLLLLALPVVLWRPLITFNKPSFLSAPTPNGYEIFLAAEKRLNGVHPSAVTNDFEVFISEHAGVFEKFAEGLKEECEAPPRTYDPAGMTYKDMISSAGSEKQ